MNHAENRYLNTCPVGCNALLETTTYVLPEGALLRCSACGQLLSQCTESDYWRSMQEFDDPQGTLPVSGSEKRRFRHSRKFLLKIAKLLGRFPEQVRLLDVGCSSGAFLGAAVKIGFLAEGVEPAPKAAAAAKAAGLNVRQGLLHEAGYADGTFDAITLFEVIEHLQQPLELLNECRRILRHDGILLIGTGNAASWSLAVMGARWEYLSIAKHGGHISFYTPASITAITQRSGFEVIEVHTRRVRFFEKGDCPKPVYRIAKLTAELLGAFAALFNRGHDMAVYLKRT